MSSLFLALVLFPRVQRRAQQELDAVIGRDRLPTFDDRQRLPYLEAICKELSRWQMVTPLGKHFLSWSRQLGFQSDDFQVFPTRHVTMIFTGAISFRKV